MEEIYSIRRHFIITCSLCTSWLKATKKRDKSKDQTFWFSLLFTMIWVIPIVFMNDLVGTRHLGIMAASIVRSIFGSE